jgi:hypothetical protein
MRRGIGVNQGRTLGLLMLMGERAVSGSILEIAADANGDRTRGRRTLKVMHGRGLIAQVQTRSFVGDESGPLWVSTVEGAEAFFGWFSRRVIAIREEAS